ncbi:PE-PPE domain-containing protein [Mycobacterium sp. HUMS_1102779]|uniref:PE-PPE domain-containing protein n=1 Tax=Mycobacterium sp. HUMS_1102779 TaxID=3383487 RepID=UPI003899BA97
MASTAADVAGIGSAISAAIAQAAVPTTGLAAAAQDEVSAGAARFFAAFGRDYHAVVARASAFHDEFTRAPAAAASTYAQAEAAGAALLPGGIGGPAPTVSAGPAAALAALSTPAAGGTTEALILGHTGTALPGPQYLAAIANAFMGYFYVHDTCPMMTPDQVAHAVPLPTSPGYTQYYMVMTQNLPLLQPIRDIPYAGPPIADLFQPDLRVLVEMGYADYGAGGDYANIPTPAGLFSVPNPFTVIPDLALGSVQGPYGAAVDIGVEAGLLSPSMYPSVYPWVPSVDPHLNVFFGQPGTTLLSVLSGDAGQVLDLIPPVLN